MTSLAVFDTPSPPDGWEGREVIRIVDPLGRGAAWIEPMFAGICVGFFVRERQLDPWLTALTSLPPEDIKCRSAVGCELLWLRSDGAQPELVRTLGSGWTFETRDPTSVTVTGHVDKRRVEVTYRCEDGVLMIDAGVMPSDSSTGSLGLRVHANVAEVIKDDMRQVSLVGERLPAGRLLCLTGTGMQVRWKREDDASPVMQVDWIPWSGTESSVENSPSFRWSMEAAFE